MMEDYIVEEMIGDEWRNVNERLKGFATAMESEKIINSQISFEEAILWVQFLWGLERIFETLSDRKRRFRITNTKTGISLPGEFL